MTEIRSREADTLDHHLTAEQQVIRDLRRVIGDGHLLMRQVITPQSMMEARYNVRELVRTRVTEVLLEKVQGRIEFVHGHDHIHDIEALTGHVYVFTPQQMEEILRGLQVLDQMGAAKGRL